jgi:hypothetical protein
MDGTAAVRVRLKPDTTEALNQSEMRCYLQPAEGTEANISFFVARGNPEA